MRFKENFCLRVCIVCSLYVLSTHSNAINITHKVKRMREEEAAKQRIRIIMLKTINVEEHAYRANAPDTKGWPRDDASKQKNSSKFYRMKHRLVHQSETKKNSSQNVILFKLMEGLDSEDTDIYKASLFITAMRRRRCTKRGKRKGRSITLRAYNYNLPKAAGEKRKISEITEIIKKTDTLDLPIPLSVIHRALKSPDRTLAVRIRCKGCSKGIKLILPRTRFRQRRRSCHRRRRQEGGLGRKRQKRGQKRRFKSRKPQTKPMLILHTLKKIQRIG